MKTSSIILFILSGITAMLTSCTTKSSYETHPLSFATISAGKTYRLKGSAKALDHRDDLIFVDSVSLLMPSLVENKDVRYIQDAILKAAFDSTAVDHASLIEDYFEKNAREIGFEAVPSDSSLNYIQADGYEMIRGYVINLTPGLMVYCVSNYNMMPIAAHGMQTRSYINYSIDTNKVISLSDLFTPEGLSALPSLIAKRAEDNVAVNGPTEITALPANGNFYLSPAGEIVFAYQPYEVASYAQGFINIAFYPYELINYLTPSAVSYFGLSDIAISSN